jgi:hypothetical protein
MAKCLGTGEVDFFVSEPLHLVGQKASFDFLVCSYTRYRLFYLMLTLPLFAIDQGLQGAHSKNWGRNTGLVLLGSAVVSYLIFNTSRRLEQR